MFDKMGEIVFMALMLILSAVWQGMAIMFLWDWFVVDLLVVKETTLLKAIGFGLFVQSVNLQYGHIDKNDDDQMKEYLKKLFLTPPILVDIGYFIHQYCM